MLHRLTQLQQKLQLDYKTNITQIHQNNQAVWKANNHGFKEGTFIPTGRSGRDVERCGEVWRSVETWSGAEGSGETQRGRDVEWAVPHSRVVGKSWEGYLRSKGSQSQARPPSPGFQCHEDKSS